MIDHAVGSLRRASLRRQLDAVAAGSSSRLRFDVEASTFDPSGVLAEVAAQMQVGSVGLRRLVAAFHLSGAVNRVIDGLGASNAERQIRSCRTLGALRLEAALPWVTPLLRARDWRVSASAARALGRIGGVRSADALLAAIQRRGPRRAFVVALALAAPDLYLESALSSHLHRGTLGAVAVAAGLRRRRTAIGPLTALLGAGTNRQRLICCRALGWTHAQSAIQPVMQALFDRDWRVRISAIKSVTALVGASQYGQPEVVTNVELLFRDPDPRVRKAAYGAARRLRMLKIAKRAPRSPWR